MNPESIPIDLPPIVFEPAHWRWLIGQSVGLALAIVWIVMLLRDNLASRMRNEQLSDYLLQVSENASAAQLRQAEEYRQQSEKSAAERAKQSEQHALSLDASQRAVTEAYTRVLERALTWPERSSRRSGREQLPNDG